jgi:hypothetical protein
VEPLPDTTALASALAASAAMIVLGLRKRLLVRRRSICPACRVDSRTCRCRRD